MAIGEHKVSNGRVPEKKATPTRPQVTAKSRRKGSISLRSRTRSGADWNLCNRCPLKAGAYLARKREKTMPKDSHSEAAEHHERAAKSHRTAAEHHGRGEHEKGHAASSEAHGHSGRAHESSSRAHTESGEHNKKR